MPFLTLLPRGFSLALGAEGPHTFCGPQAVPGAECPNCDLPLYRYLELDARDPLLALEGITSPTIPLLFCWRCKVAQQPFYYGLRGNAVVLLSYGKGMEGDDFPFPDYPPHFPPAHARLQPLASFETPALLDLNEGADSHHEPFRMPSPPTHQVGGVPILMQGDYHEYYPEAATCPECSSPMPFLAAFGDRCLDPRGFTGNDFVQVLFSLCPRHMVISAHQACD